MINVRDHIEWGKMNILRNVILIGKEGHKDWIGKKKPIKSPWKEVFGDKSIQRVITILDGDTGDGPRTLSSDQS